MPSNKSSWKENSKMMHRPRQAFIYIDLNKHQRKTHSWLLARYNSIAIFGKTFKYLMRQRHRQGTLFKPTPLSINNSATFAIYHKSDANLQNIKRYVAMHLTGITPHIAIGRPHFRTFLRILTAGTKDGSVRTDGWMVGTEPNRTEWTTGIPIFGAIFIIFQMSFAHKSLKSTWYIEPSKSRSKQCWRFHLTLFEMGFFGWRRVGVEVLPTITTIPFFTQHNAVVFRLFFNDGLNGFSESHSPTFATVIRGSCTYH